MVHRVSTKNDRSPPLIIKFSFPMKIHSFLTKCILSRLFSLFSKTPPILFQDPPILFSAFYVGKASESSVDLGQLNHTGSDGRNQTFCCLQLLSLSCHGKRTRWQIITEAGSHGLAEVQFISRDLFKFLTRGQHAGSTVRRQVSHEFESQRLTNSGPKPETQV